MWNQLCSVGDEHLDDQHRKIFDLVNELDRSIMCGRVGQQAGAAVASLVEYIGVHFRDEEKLMREIGYSEYARHKELHSEMTAHVAQLVQRLGAGHTPCIFQLTAFLKEWFLRHIDGEDKRITAERIALHVAD
jgi:hemerythrin-like metal-binding protein